MFDSIVKNVFPFSQIVPVCFLFKGKVQINRFKKVELFARTKRSLCSFINSLGPILQNVLSVIQTFDE
jgi:hypothetical protein